jgi:hypothetical protein
VVGEAFEIVFGGDAPPVSRAVGGRIPRLHREENRRASPTRSAPVGALGVGTDVCLGKEAVHAPEEVLCVAVEYRFVEACVVVSDCPVVEAREQKSVGELPFVVGSARRRSSRE